MLIAGGKIAVEEAGEVLLIAFIAFTVVAPAEVMFRHHELIRLGGYCGVIELPHDTGFLLHEADAVLRFGKGGFAHFDLRLDVARAELVGCAAEQAHSAFFYLEAIRRCCNILLKLRVFGAKVTDLIGI